jgi:DNA-binding NtrC family response regulator
MMNAALVGEGVAVREGEAAEPQTGESMSMCRRVESLREQAAALLRQVEQLESELASRGAGQRADLQTEVQRFECEMIRDALRRTGGHQRRAARVLGVKVSTLNAKIKRYGIRPEDALPSASLRLVGD